MRRIYGFNGCIYLCLEASDTYQNSVIGGVIVKQKLARTRAQLQGAFRIPQKYSSPAGEAKSKRTIDLHHNPSRSIRVLIIRAPAQGTTFVSMSSFWELLDITRAAPPPPSAQLLLDDTLPQ